MAYGTIKVDTITFTDNDVDKSVSISGLVQNPTFSGNITVTGTVSGDTIQGQIVSGVTVTGTTANFVSGVFTTQISGATVVGSIGNFTTFTGGTITVTSGVIASGTEANPSLSILGDANTGLYSPGADQLAISTNGTGRLFIASDGRVGVGAANTTGGINLEVTGSSPVLRVTGTSASNPTLELVSVGATLWSQIVSGSDGSLSFSRDGSERMRLDSAGRLGVGTSDPSTILTIQKNIDSSAYGSGTQVIDFKTPYPGFDVGTIKSSIYSGVSSQTPLATNKGYLAFLTHNGTSLTETLRIESNGSVGIGTQSPGGPLEVIGTTATIAARANTGVSSKAIQIYNDGTDSYIDSTAYGAGSGGGIAFRRNGTGEMGRFDTSGRLLVGTSSARSGFVNDATVSAAIQLEGAGGAYNDNKRFLSQTYNVADNYGPAIILAKSRSGSLGGVTVVQSDDEVGGMYFCGADGTDLPAAASIIGYVDGTPGANNMPGRIVFSTTADGQASPTPRMTIQNDGDVLIGRTSELGSVHRLVIERDNLAVGINTFNGGNNEAIRFYNAGTPVGTISTTGSATAYNTSSDYRLKENVTAVTDGITRLQQLKPSRFNFIVDPDKTVDGFIAHEVQAVVPEAITGEKDAVDDEGSPVYQGIDQSKLVPLLTAALQEAVAKIESLEARLDAANL